MDPKILELQAELEREKRLREDLEAELTRERTRREGEQRRREEEQRRREEEQQRREEEQQRREEAEALATSSERSTLPLFLHACHELLVAIQIVTDPTRTTQGAVTKPRNRRAPSRIIVWEKFVDEQMEVWAQFDQHPFFLTEKLFPSLHQLDYVRQFISPISSESDLRYYERETVENQVRTMVDRIYENDGLRQAFGLRGSITFESHVNLG